MTQIVVKDEALPMADINPTPLIDVLLVLLIVLIIALPLATHGTGIALPGPYDGPARPSVTIDVDFDGSLYWNGESISDWISLERRFQSTAKLARQPNVFLNASPSARYEWVALVLATAQRSGIERLGFAGHERFMD